MWILMNKKQYIEDRKHAPELAWTCNLSMWRIRQGYIWVPDKPGLQNKTMTQKGGGGRKEGGKKNKKEKESKLTQTE